MLTPQEVASHSFAKATLGGYNMAMVDEFLDVLTEDYTALYNDNAILKNKLKVLSETVEEYRATDSAMRKTLFAAQQMADSIVSEAEQRKAALVEDAEKQANARIAELSAAVALEEHRLREAQKSTAAYVQKLQALYEQEMEFLSHLGEMVPPKPPEGSDLSDDIKASVSARLYIDQRGEAGETSASYGPGGAEAAGDEAAGPAPGQPAEAAGLPDDQPAPDPEATRRFDDLQFGRDYEIT